MPTIEMPTTLRQEVASRWATLKNDRSSWLAHYRDLSEMLQPRLGRYLLTDANRGDKRHGSIYDNTGTRALRVLASGFMAGATSPARPWFAYTLQDPDLAKFHKVQVWLRRTTEDAFQLFARSNTYRALHQTYEELGLFGTGPTIVLPHAKNGLHHTPLTAGEYAIAVDYDGNVDTLYREFRMSAAAIVHKFGLPNCSSAVRNAWESKRRDDMFTVVHAIEPRVDRDPTKIDTLNTAWRSVYFEEAGETDKVLAEDGYAEFPVLCPRWATAGGDHYGNSPGMEALGDVKGLQHQQLRKHQCIDYKTLPPLQVPSSVTHRQIERLPGGVTPVDVAQAGAGVRTLFEASLDLADLTADIAETQRRIRESFYTDMFLMLATSDTRRMTATEVAERHEEKLVMLGPVIERLHTELLAPLTMMAFNQLVASGRLTPPPPELDGQLMVPEFVSVLAQAQRAIGVNGIDRFVGNLGAVAQIDPDVIDNFDSDEWARNYSTMLGTPPVLLRRPEDRDQRRAARMRALAAKEQAESGAVAARGMKDAVGAMQLQPRNDLLSLFSGYGSPSGVEVA